jgi:sec-independent protein translocase protein TatC
MAEPEGSEVQSGVLEHIDALRLTLLKTVVTYVVFCIPCWFLSEYLLNYLLAHAVPEGFTIHYFTLLEPFFARIKLMLTVAAMTSLPFTLYYIWQFVAPALHDNEKKFIRPLVASSFLLACAGTAAAYFFLMPCVIAFSLSFSGPNMDAVIGVESFISMLLILVIAGALLFQFPVVLFTLLTLGVIDVESMRKRRPAVIVGILVLAGFLTPPDVVSQIALALPAWLFYELSILIFSHYKKPDRSGAEAKHEA